MERKGCLNKVQSWFAFMAALWLAWLQQGFAATPALAQMAPKQILGLEIRFQDDLGTMRRIEVQTENLPSARARVSFEDGHILLLNGQRTHYFRSGERTALEGTLTSMREHFATLKKAETEERGTVTMVRSRSAAKSLKLSAAPERISGTLHCKQHQLVSATGTTSACLLALDPQTQRALSEQWTNLRKALDLVGFGRLGPAEQDLVSRGYLALFYLTDKGKDDFAWYQIANVRLLPAQADLFSLPAGMMAVPKERYFQKVAEDLVDAAFGPEEAKHKSSEQAGSSIKKQGEKP